MSQRTELGNIKPYQIIDNQLLAAQRLVDYMMKPKSATETRNIVDAAAAGGARYTEPLHSWLWFPIYRFTRQREESLNKLISSLNMNPKEDRRLMLKTFLDAMSEGTWEESSLNTDIMYELLKLLPHYRKTDPNPQESFPYQNMAHFFERFKEHANTVLAAMKEDKPETIKQLQEGEKSQLPRLSELKQRYFAEAKAEKPVSRSAVIDIPKSDPKERQSIKEMLLACLKNPQKEQVAAEPRKKTSKTIAPIEEMVAEEAAKQALLNEVDLPMKPAPEAPPAPPVYRVGK